MIEQARSLPLASFNSLDNHFICLEKKMWAYLSRHYFTNDIIKI